MNDSCVFYLTYTLAHLRNVVSLLVDFKYYFETAVTPLASSYEKKLQFLEVVPEVHSSPTLGNVQCLFGFSIACNSGKNESIFKHIW